MSEISSGLVAVAWNGGNMGREWTMDRTVAEAWVRGSKTHQAVSLCLMSDAEAVIAKLREELETERMRLVACGDGNKEGGSTMIIGTCSICGGAVTVPDVWGGIVPPVPTCSGCGAQAAQHGPIIQMRPAPPVRFNFTTTSEVK